MFLFKNITNIRFVYFLNYSYLKKKMFHFSLWVKVSMLLTENNKYYLLFLYVVNACPNKVMTYISKILFMYSIYRKRASMSDEFSLKFYYLKKYLTFL